MLPAMSSCTLPGRRGYLISTPSSLRQMSDYLLFNPRACLIFSVVWLLEWQVMNECDNEWQVMMAQHGGRFEHYFDASVVTHVVAQDLAHTHLLRFDSLISAPVLQDCIAPLYHTTLSPPLSSPPSLLRMSLCAVVVVQLADVQAEFIPHVLVCLISHFLVCLHPSCMCVRLFVGACVCAHVYGVAARVHCKMLARKGVNAAHTETGTGR